MTQPQRQGWRFPPERRHVLREETRRQRMPPEQTLAALDAQPGETILDVGAGTGYFTEPLSEMVGERGRVLAVDVEPEMVAELRGLPQELGNVEVVQSEEIAIPLPDAVADAALAAFVLHEPADPAAFLSELRRLLKPGGRLQVIDWQTRETEQGPPVEHRLSPEEATALLGSVGFLVNDVPAPNPDVYVLLARRQ